MHHHVFLLLYVLLNILKLFFARCVEMEMSYLKFVLGVLAVALLTMDSSPAIVKRKWSFNLD